MYITIKINCDNAAFCDSPYEELSRILSTLAEEMQEHGEIIEKNITDFNGNNVGNLEISE
jgi:hypothetical protein